MDIQNSRYFDDIEFAYYKDIIKKAQLGPFKKWYLKNKDEVFKYLRNIKMDRKVTCPYCYEPFYSSSIAKIIPCPGYGNTCKTRITIPRGGCCYSCFATRKYFDNILLPMKPCSECEK